MSKFDPFALKENDRFYFYESKKGKERSKYRLAEVVYTTSRFIVARVLRFDKPYQPLYITCFNYNSIACGDIILKDMIESSEKANMTDAVLDM